MIILVRAYTHGGLGTPTACQHNILDLQKLSIFFLVLLMGFKLCPLNLELDTLPIEPPCYAITHHVFVTECLVVQFLQLQDVHKELLQRVGIPETGARAGSSLPGKLLSASQLPSAQLSSAQVKTESEHLGKPAFSPPCLSQGFHTESVSECVSV